MTISFYTYSSSLSHCKIRKRSGFVVQKIVWCWVVKLGFRSIFSIIFLLCVLLINAKCRLKKNSSIHQFYSRLQMAGPIWLYKLCKRKTTKKQKPTKNKWKTLARANIFQGKTVNGIWCDCMAIQSFFVAFFSWVLGAVMYQTVCVCVIRAVPVDRFSGVRG